MRGFLDTRLGREERATLGGLVGRRLDFYRCDVFGFSNSVYGTLGLVLGDEALELTNYTEPEEGYFGYAEDVSRFRLIKVKAADLESGVEGGAQVDHAVHDTVTDVLVVDDREVATRDGEPFFDYRYTRAIVLRLKGYDIAFERDDDVFETIRVLRGRDALSLVGPADEFLSPVGGCEHSTKREVASVANSAHADLSTMSAS